ncbi:hypothetical protein EXIGLDRAFT_609999 [Exidia glandulosa HHB12029]|uniref:Uncharacterized protein n=1 Tax=Exidia glandulosa HHB12029 TaxID=1314781 RepID=A0A165K6B9_EXIGL|nr:hypothetical protein EXIGLDRAFT_609999 [Exidia glandulosa HHB12029]
MADTASSSQDNDEQTRNDATYAKYVDAVVKDLEADPVPPLSRPPGLEHPPGEDAPPTGAFSGMLRAMRDQQSSLREHEHIKKQLSRSYVSDVRDLTRKHGGKTWVAPNVLIREDAARYFPEVTGVSIDTRGRVNTRHMCAGKVSLVTIMGTSLSEEHVSSFTHDAVETHKSNPHFRFVQINLQENKMKYYVLSLFVARLRDKIDPALQPYYIISAQNFEYLRDPMLMQNKFVGYVFLLDPQQRIRWAGSAFATPAERDSLRRCAGVLLDRAAEDARKKTPKKTRRV